MTKKSKAEICENVQKFKSKCAEYGLMDADGSIMLPKVYEDLESLWPEWLMLVGEIKDMGKNLGVTDPVGKTITLREDVYLGMCAGDAEHMFTAAHELGHMVMHAEITFARSENHSAFEKVSFESEADDFAGELLGFDSPANQEVRNQMEQLLNAIKNYRAH